MSGGLFRLEGKRAVVTGAGSGIGRAIAKAFAEAGAGIEVVDIDEKAAAGVAAEIAAAGGRAKARVCDVADGASVRRVFAEMIADGGIQILVNNAGVSHIGNLESTTEADFERLFAVNVKSVFLCAQAAMPHMKEHGGVILNMASIAATAGLADRLAYSMTKGAVRTLTFSIAKDYLANGIRCNCISPARVHTPFVDGYLKRNYPGREEEMFGKLAASQPIGRMATPEEVALLAQYLCSEEASFITGMDYPLDGGFVYLRG